MAERQHLYKAKRKDNGEWVEGSLIISGESCFISTGRVNVKGLVACDKLCFEIFEVIPETVCEWTGLEDKNDKLIFEDDIVKTKKYGKIIGHSNVNDYDVFKVVYEPAVFRLENTCRGFNLVGNPADYEVIGNIHDNLELLEV